MFTADESPRNETLRLFQWRFFTCQICLNTFATVVGYKSESTDGSTPQCCPYCGVIFDNFTELK